MRFSRLSDHVRSPDANLLKGAFPFMNKCTVLGLSGQVYRYIELPKMNESAVQPYARISSICLLFTYGIFNEIVCHPR